MPMCQTKEERLSKLSRSEQLKLIFEWVKTGVINRARFVELINLCSGEKK